MTAHTTVRDNLSGGPASESDRATGIGKMCRVVVAATAAGFVVLVEAVTQASDHVLADFAAEAREQGVALEIQAERQAGGGVVGEIVRP